MKFKDETNRKGYVQFIVIHMHMDDSNATNYKTIIKIYFVCENYYISS